VTETTISGNRNRYGSARSESRYGANLSSLNGPNSSLTRFRSAPEIVDDPNRVTINDVAREAGVSVATVSKVVNGRYGVSPATAAKVMQVVEQMGYESSLVASSLRRSSTNVIGVLVAAFEPFSTELLKGMSAHAIGRNYQLMAYSGAIADDQAVGWERRSISRLGGTLMDGAVIVTPTVALPTTKMPIVAVDPHNDPDGPPFVNSDSIGGARAAVEHLIGLGHTRIAHLRGRADLASSQEREEGWRQALRAAGIEPDPSLIREGNYRREMGRLAALDLLQSENRPTAIFAANDLSAFGVVDAALEFGLQVPADLSVIGFDDVPEAAMSSPSLTTVAQPLHEMGAVAYDMLLDLIQGYEVDQHVQLPTQLVVRETTAPPPASLRP